MKMNRKKIASVICIILAAVLLFSLLLSAFGSGMAVSQAQIDALKQQQAGIEQQRNDLKGRIAEVQAEMESVMELKEFLDVQNELARQEIELINEQIALYERLIEIKAQELEEAKEVEEAQKAALRRRMRAMEENGSLSYFAIIFKASGFTDLLARMDFVASIMRYDKQLEEDYIAAREHVEVVKAEYEATLAETEIVKAELLVKKAALEADIAAAEQLIRDLEADIERLKEEFEANEANERAIRAQIDEMVKELERQQAAGNTPYVPSTGAFSWPVPGYTHVGSHFGNRVHPIFGDTRFHAGIDIGAPTGTRVIAADSGTVVTAAYSSSYGNYIVISHGNGNYTLYAHLHTMAVSANQAVSKGDTIGGVGSTGWSTGPHLHFEIKIGGQLVDPLSQV